jgi:predicted PurR-regulated permease PerM
VSPQLSLTRVVVNTIAVLSIIALAWVILQIRSILILLTLGIIFAAAIEPLVFRLRRAGLRRGQAIMVVYLALFSIIGFALYIIVPLLIRQVTAFDTAVPDIFENLRQQALRNDNSLIRTSGYRLLLRIEETYYNVKNSPEIGQDQARGVVTSVLGVFFTIVSLMIVAFYWMTEKVTVKRVILGLFPFSRRARAHAIWDEIEYRIGGWTRGQLILMVVIGSLSGLFYYGIDLRFWLALAIFAGLTEAVPFIGPVIGGGTAALIALADSPEKALIVIVFATVLQQLEGAFLVPRIMKNAVGMNPLTVVLAVLIGSVLAGPMGALLAIPIGAACQVLIGNLLRLRDDFIASELRTLDVAPLSARHFDSPFVPPRRGQIPLPTPPEPGHAPMEGMEPNPGATS